MSEYRRRFALMIALAASLAVACSTPVTGDAGGDASADVASGRWTCPSEWVATAFGGCGPAVLLCVADGGAAPGACEHVDLSHPHPIDDGKGGTGTSFYRLPDGGIGGGWHEPGEPGGPPATDWAPDAGITSCAAGWMRLADGTCDPQLRTDCPSGSEALPGGICTLTATRDCPAGEYADVSAEAGADTIVHVRAGADATMANGSVALPFATIAAGIAAAGTDGWVLVAAGRYTESLRVTTRVHIVGACSALVTQIGVPEAVTIASTGSSARLDLRGVTISGGLVGLSAFNGAVVMVRAAVVTATLDIGVTAEGNNARLELTDSVVRTTRPATPAQRGIGVIARPASTIVATRFAVVSAVAAGILTDGTGARLELTDSVVRQTRPRADGAFGMGIDAEFGSAVVATRVLVADNADVGVIAQNRGSRLEIADSIVRGTRARADGTRGSGLVAQTGATLEATRILLSENSQVGAAALGNGTQFELTDSVVRGTRPNGNGTHGHGLSAEEGANFTATHVVIAANSEVGAAAIDATTRMQLSDSVVRETRTHTDGGFGYGLAVGTGATMVASRMLLADNTDVGVTVLGAGSRLEMADSVVRGTRIRRDGRGGFGIAAIEGATAMATRVLLADNAEFGAVAGLQDARIDLVDSVVLGTRPYADGSFGCGLFATDGAVLRASGVLVADNVVSGAAVYRRGRIELVDSAIRGTRPNDRGWYGGGAQATIGGALIANRVLFVDNTESGLIGHGADTSLTLADVIVTRVHVSSVRGLGPGLLLLGAAHGDFARVAVTDVAAAGVAVGAPEEGAGMTPAELRGTDLYVTHVIASTAQPRTIVGAQRLVAYGLYSGASGILDVAHAVVDDGEFGAFNRGALVLHQGVVARQRIAARARYSVVPATSAVFDAVHVAETARDELVDDTLPEISYPIESPCLMPPCM